MVEITANSKIAMVEEIDLFSLPPTQGIVDKTQFVECYTSSSDVNASPSQGYAWVLVH